MALGNVVRSWRRECGWKQQELARRTGFPQGTISNMERGRLDNPTQDTLNRLASAFGVTVEVLLRATSASAPPPLTLIRVDAQAAAELDNLQGIWWKLQPSHRTFLMQTALALAEKYSDPSMADSPTTNLTDDSQS